MYEELVKRLREHGEFLIASDRMKAPPNVNVRNLFAEDYAQAADAIETMREMVAIAHNELANVIQSYEESKPRWIPVTERLPKEERKSCWVCTDTGYQCECRWTNNRFGIGELDEWGCTAS